MQPQYKRESSHRPYLFLAAFYGITYMPAKFQKTMDNLLKGLKKTHSFIDDIIRVTGGGKKTQRTSLQMLQKTRQKNLITNLEKYHFAKNKIAL